MTTATNKETNQMTAALIDMFGAKPPGWMVGGLNLPALMYWTKSLATPIHLIALS